MKKKELKEILTDNQKLKEFLTLTQKDWDEYLEETGEEGRRFLQEHRYHFDPVIFPTPFAFNCKTCVLAAPWLNPYQINKSRKPVVPTTEGIFLLEDSDIKPEYNTKLHHVKDVGYVCAHCLISVHTGEDQFVMS